MAARLCPHCRQPMAYERAGVFLTPLKAEIFDLIKCTGDIGVSADELVHAVYWDRVHQPALSTIKAHVWQINAVLEQTNWIIRSHGGRWQLCRRLARSAA